MGKKGREKNVLYCEKCDSFVKYEIIKKREIYEIKNDKIEILSNIAKCANCGTELYDIKLEDNNLKRVYRKYAKKHKLVLPEETKEIREKYGLNQHLFARILGIGKATIQRYENGALPTKAYSDLIKSMKKPGEFQRKLEENKHYISKSEYETAKTALSKVTRNQKESSDEEEVLTELNDVLEVIHSSVFNFDKLLGTVAVIFSKIKEMNEDFMYKTKLLKLLWFTERKFEKLFGKRLIGIKFAHGNYGPIPDKYPLLISYLEQAGVITVTLEEDEDGSAREKLFLKDDTFSKYLDEKEKNFIEKIVRRFGKMNTKRLSEETHKDELYKNTENGEIIIF
jgi:putative zinc finger/helix-turn-helix YgiT family protein